MECVECYILCAVLPHIAGTEENHQIPQDQCRREGGGGSRCTLPGLGGQEGDPGPEYVAYVFVFVTSRPVIICQFYK